MDGLDVHILMAVSVRPSETQNACQFTLDRSSMFKAKGSVPSGSKLYKNTQSLDAKLGFILLHLLDGPLLVTFFTNLINV